MDWKSGSLLRTFVGARRRLRAGVGALGLSLALLGTGPAAAYGPVVAFGGGTPPAIEVSDLNASYDTTCARRAGTGAVVCFGGFATGIYAPPAALDGTAGTAASLGSGLGYLCAIQAGTSAVVCWGFFPVPPSSVNGTAGTAEALSVGVSHACAIQQGTGIVVCWGDPGKLHTQVPAAVNGVEGTATAISVGHDYSCAIQAGTNAPICWGFGPDSGFHQLYNGPPPPPPGSSAAVSAISVGDEHACLIRQGGTMDGSVACWGSVLYGEAVAPTSVVGSFVDGVFTGGATAIGAGRAYSCAIQKGTDAVVCWGRPNHPVPEPAPPSSVDGTNGTARAIDVGFRHACAIRSGTNALVCWGELYSGQDVPPASVNGSQGIASVVAAGRSHACALRLGSRGVVCWGQNLVGETVPPDTVNGTAGTASRIALGRNFGCAIRASDGHVDCWGSNNVGQASPPAELVSGPETATRISAGNLQACAIRQSDGGVVCWGLGRSFGIPPVPPPTVDGTLGSASEIVSNFSANGTCAIRSGDRGVVCWDFDSDIYDLRVPAALSAAQGGASAIAMTVWYACGIRASTGAVVCWGNVPGPVPAAVDGSAGTATAIASSVDHACAVQAGTRDVICWGNDAFGQKTVPGSLTGADGGALAIALGDNFSVATAVPEPSSVVAIGAGAALLAGLARRRYAPRRRARRS